MLRFTLYILAAVLVASTVNADPTKPVEVVNEAPIAVEVQEPLAVTVQEPLAVEVTNLPEPPDECPVPKRGTGKPKGGRGEYGAQTKGGKVSSGNFKGIFGKSKD